MIRMSLLSLLCLLFPVLIYAQSEHFVESKLLDEETGRPIVGATVYYRGTAVYTETNAEGVFVIPVYTQTKTELIVSHMGYEVMAYPSPFTDVPEVVYLRKRIQELDEVVVTTHMFTREQLMKAFKEKFLGTDVAGKACLIENEDAVQLTYRMGENKLIASAAEPISIYNKYLGYHIDFDLLFFEVVFAAPNCIKGWHKTAFYYGFPLFKEIKSARRYIKRRERIYKSSPQCFFAALYAENIGEAGFSIIQDDPKYDPYTRKKRTMQLKQSSVFTLRDTALVKRVYIHPDEYVNLKDFWLDEEDGTRVCRIVIQYKQEHTSRLLFKTETFLLDQYGAIDVFDKVVFGGEFANSLMGRALPIDYVLPQE